MQAKQVSKLCKASEVLYWSIH